MLARMRLARCLCLAAMPMAAASSALADGAQDGAGDGVVLEATGPWQLDYGEERCRLTRTLGTGDNLHVVYFEQYAPSRAFVLAAAGPEFGRFQDSRNVDIAFGEQEPREDAGSVGTLANYGKAVFSTSMTAERPPELSGQRRGYSNLFGQIDTQVLEGADHIVFTQGRRKLRMNMRSLAAPLKALNQCGEVRLAAMGLDIERHRTMRAGPVLLNKDDISRDVQRSFPRDALRKGQRGEVRVLVTLDPAGEIASCRVQEMVEFPDVTKRVCAAMGQADYTPAIDAEGEAMASFATLTIAYDIN